MTISDQTRKHYVRALKQFSKWLYDYERVNTDLLSRLEIPAVREIVHKRRALSEAESMRLLQAAKNSNIAYRGILGYERYLIYYLALTTGLRVNEIRTLTISDFDFIEHTVTIKLKNDKARRGATLPLDEDLSEQIKEFTTSELPSSKALNIPKDRAAEMLRTDLKAAGIEYITENGCADFHSLRHTFGTGLARGGTMPQTAQRLMRHSDPRLTQNLYTHLDTSDLRIGTDKLPDYSKIEEQLDRCDDNNS